MVVCSDGSYYTGWTTDPERRVQEHNAGTGSYYTRWRRPVKLVYQEKHPDRSSAMRREYTLKQLTHQQKADLVELYQENKNLS
jgi:putative endonuclease